MFFRLQMRQLNGRERTYPQLPLDAPVPFETAFIHPCQPIVGYGLKIFFFLGARAENDADVICITDY